MRNVFSLVSVKVVEDREDSHSMNWMDLERDGEICVSINALVGRFETREALVDMCIETEMTESRVK